MALSFLLPCRIATDARKLKADVPEGSTVSSKRGLDLTPCCASDLESAACEDRR